jgi:hypothetical protein
VNAGRLEAAPLSALCAAVASALGRGWLAGCLLSGAAGCTTDAGPRERTAAPARVLSREAEPGPIDVESLNRLYQRLPHDRSLLAAGHAAARALLLAELRALGLQPELLPFDWAGGAAADLANVQARLGRLEVDSPLLIVSCHYDSVEGTPGADDNGSGTVALLELARRLADRPLAIELRLVWFDAEEPGLIGSGAYVDDLSIEERRRLLGVINLETMGYTDRRAGSQRMPPGSEALFDPGDRGDFLLVVGNLRSALLGRIVHEGLQPEHGADFRSELFALLPGAGWLFADSRRSDHARFWDADLPAVMLTDTANLRSPHYHRPTDTVATLDLPFLAAAVRGVERAVLRLADEAKAPEPTTLPR